MNIDRFQFHNENKKFLSRADKTWNAILTIPFFIYAVYWGTRHIDVGTDTPAYINMSLAYLNADPTFLNSIDKGFLAIISLSHFFSDRPEALLITVCFLEAICFYGVGVLFLRKPFYIFIYAIFLLSSPFYLSININILRHGIAIAVALLGMGLTLHIRHPLYKILAAYPPTLFHNIAGLMTLPIFISINRTNLIWLWLTLSFTSYFSSLYSSFFTQYLTGRYADYALTETTYRIGFRPDFTLFSSLPLLLLFIVPFRKMSIDTRRVFNAYLLINGLGLTMNFISFSDRLLTNSWVIIPLLFALVLRDINEGAFKKRVNRNFFTFIVTVGMVILNLILYIRPAI